MLLVDSRAGSHELVKPLQAMGLPAEETTLDFGDVAFFGRGIGGVQVFVGIEFKKLGECVQAMRTGRLQGHQAPGMAEAYDFRSLLIEGELLFNAKGQLLRRVGRRDTRPIPGQMGMGEFEERLLSLQLCWGLAPRLVTTRAHALKWIESAYRWWTDQDLDQHKSHLAIYTPPRITPIGDFRETVCRFPHIGLRTSKAVETAFGGSLRRAVNAPAETWAEICTQDAQGKSRRLGMKVAQEIHAFLGGA